MKTAGWSIIAFAFFVMCGDIASDILKLMNLSDMKTPAFIGSALLHFSAVGIAALGGKLLPMETKE